MLNALKRAMKRRLDGRWVASFRRRLQSASGRLGEALIRRMPNRVRRLESGDFSALTESHSPVDFVLRAGMARRAMASDDPEDWKNLHTRFWASSAAHRYHDQNRGAHRDVTLPNFGELIDALVARVEARPDICGVCEIGCGSGEFLEYLAERLPRVERWVGIDLSEETVAENRRRIDDSRIEFVAADADRWIRQHGEAHWLYLSHRGVLEYFPKPGLEGLFGHLGRECAPNLVFVLEPLSIDYDLSRESESRTYGVEFSLSHNYPLILREAGFDILRQQEVAFFDHRLVGVIAEVGEDRGRP